MTKAGSRTRAIRNTLARLGMQASPEQVVAALAGLGIVVNEALVRQVKVEMLKQAAKVGRQQVRPPQIERPRVRRPPKLPPRRSFRSQLRRRRQAASWLEGRVLPDGLQAPVEREGLVNFPPLAGVPHVGEVEAAVADVFQAGEGASKVGRMAVGPRLREVAMK
jgi:hypothetical protein